MLKTHEKSRFEVMNGKDMKGSGRIVIQVAEEKLYTNASGMACFLCETVKPEDYNRTTAEGRAAEAELAAETEAHKIEMEEAQAKIDALEELLEEARDAREGMRNAVAAVREENRELYKAIVECRHIFGELPPEIETLIAKGEN